LTPINRFPNELCGTSTVDEQVARTSRFSDRGLRQGIRSSGLLSGSFLRSYAINAIGHLAVVGIQEKWLSIGAVDMHCMALLQFAQKRGCISKIQNPIGSYRRILDFGDTAPFADTLHEAALERFVLAA
jgi:hypothetical protein